MWSSNLNKIIIGIKKFNNAFIATTHTTPSTIILFKKHHCYWKRGHKRRYNKVEKWKMKYFFLKRRR
jgi:hypothetical protein